jgi:hypothetical protein
MGTGIMSSDEGFVSAVVGALARALAPLADATDAAQVGALLGRLGWPSEPEDAVTARFAATATAVGQLADDADAGAGAAVLVAGVAEVMAALGTLREVTATSAPFDDPAFWTALPEELLGLLVSESLEVNAPGVFGVLSLLGVFATTPVAADPTTGRAAYVARVVNWAALVRALTAPHALMGNVYGWGGDVDHARLLDSFRALVAGIGGAAAIMPLHRAFAEPFVAPDNPDRRTMRQLVAWPFVVPSGPPAATARPALVVTPLPPAGEPSARPVGLLLSPLLTGAAQATFELGDSATLTLAGEIQATPRRLGLRPDGATDEAGMVTGDLEVRIELAPATPYLLGGTAEGSRFELAGAHFALTAAGSGSDFDAGVAVGLDDALVVVDLAAADGFVGALIGRGRYELPLSLDLTWSAADGLRFSGRADISLTLPVNLTLAGVLAVSELQLTVGAGEGGGATLAVTLTGSLLLGPFTIAFDRLGIEVEARPASLEDPGNFGLVDVALGFKPPDGVGLALDAGIVGGGGYLAIDAEAGSYEGVIDLEIASVGISAVVIVDTQAPGISGWSVFFALFIDLPSIQLGFGFTLEGVGGIAGINRTVEPEALIAAVRAGSLDTVLFPTDPIAQAPEIIATFSAIFPPADGRYVFGPVVQIGWGTPALVTVELGIVLELPDPILIAVLGSLTSVLPTVDLDLVELHVDFSGVVDFEAGTLAIFASLHDSSVVGFALAGDMALRAAFTEQPTFVAALGGFHPGFDAPCGFPELQRLSLGISAGDLIDISFECYFAVTSNTVQFGAALELEAKIEGFGVEGGMSFDTLVRFQPFWFTTSVDMHVAVTAANFELLAVRLYGSLEGPNPWRVVGTAEFEFLGFPTRIHVDERIGAARADRAIEGPDVLDELCRLLDEDDSWTGGAPGAAGVALAAGPIGELVLAPDQTVVVTQRLVPLDTFIDKFGESSGLDHERFAIVVAGSTAGAAVTIEDWFAPGFFESMAPQEQLVTPSFELFPAGLEFGGSVTGGPPKPIEQSHEQFVRDPELPELPVGMVKSTVLMSEHPAASTLGSAPTASWADAEVSFATVAP